MIACLSPNGQNQTVGSKPATKLLVGTVDGICALERSTPVAPWQAAGRYLEGKHCNALMVEPHHGGIFAGFRLGSGLYFSADGGETWERRMNGITVDDIFSLAYSLEGDKVILYTGTEPAALFRSDDYGLSWTELPGVRTAPGRENWVFPGKPNIPHVKSITTSLADPLMVWALVEQGALLRTTDGGKTWNEQADYSKPDDLSYRDVHHLTMQPNNPNEIWLTTGMGIYRSLDKGETFAHLTDRSWLIGYPDHFIISPLDNDVIFVCGARTVPSIWRNTHRAEPTIMKSTDHGQTWSEVNQGFSRDGVANIEAMSIAEFPDGFSLFLGTTDGDVYERPNEAGVWTPIAHVAAVSKGNHYHLLAHA